MIMEISLFFGGIGNSILLLFVSLFLMRHKLKEAEGQPWGYHVEHIWILVYWGLVIMTMILAFSFEFLLYGISITMLGGFFALGSFVGFFVIFIWQIITG